MNVSHFINQIRNFLIQSINRIKQNKYLISFLTVLSFIYPIALIVLSWGELKRIKFLNFNFLIYAIILYFLSTIIQSLNWTLILKSNFRNFLVDLVIYFRTLLMQRLPGGVWQWIGRVNIYENSLNISSKETFSAIFFERVALIASGIICLLFVNDILIGVASFISIVIIFSFWKKKKHRCFWKSLVFQFIYVSTYMICWILGGLIMHLIIINIALLINFPISKSMTIWSITGILALTFFFLPGGIGIREFSLSALLMPELTFPQVILISLFLRVFFLVLDVMVGLLGIFLSRVLRINT